MEKRRLLDISVGLLFIILPILLYAEITIKTPAWQKVKDSTKKGNYVFLFISDNKSADSKKILVTMKEIVNRKTKTVNIVQVLRNDPQEKELIDFFKIGEDPTVITLAPNGAITGYFVKTVVKDSLISSLVSLKEAEVIKNLQDGHAVFLCFSKTDSNFIKIQNEIESVTSNFKGTVNAIYVSGGEKDLRKKVALTSDITTVLIIVPPGRAVARLEGSNITKANLMRALLSACGPGCGSCK